MKPFKFNPKAIAFQSMRRAFSRSKSAVDARDKATHPTKKGPRGGKRFICENCKKDFGIKEVEVDHIESVIPVFLSLEITPLDQIFERLFTDNLEILCRDCHKAKTKYENGVRKWWRTQKKYCVYKTTNLINNKKYIGVHGAIDVYDEYLGSGKLLKKAIEKYGKENFKKEILKVFPTARQAYEYEQYLVNDVVVEDPDFYNLCYGGSQQRMTPKIKKKMSENRKGKCTGKDNPMYGKTHTPEAKKKIASRWYATGKDNPLAKSVVCVETGEIFDSISETSFKHISRSIENGTCSGGYHWYYYGDEPPKITSKCKAAKRSVKCVETGELFDSLTDAARSCNAKHGGKIGDVCRGLRETAHGKKWEFV